MKKFFLCVEKLIPHIVIDMAVVFAVFLILNNYNPMMAFLSNRYSRFLLVVFCVSSFIESVILIHHQRKT